MRQVCHKSLKNGQRLKNIISNCKIVLEMYIKIQQKVSKNVKISGFIKGSFLNVHILQTRKLERLKSIKNY